MNRTFVPSPPMSKKSSIWIAAILMLQLFLPMACTAAEGGWQEAGVRMGIQATPKREYFHLYEAYAVYGLPWEWRTSSGWALSTQLNTSAGALVGGDETGFIGSVGTGLAFNRPGNGIALEAGVSLDLLNKDHFGQQDFRSILLWGASMGLSYRFAGGLGVGYRIQHLSNNRILYSNSTPNPGVDMHMFGVSWNF
ncbi:MAG: acyloxyacyl hydrolase [Desulfuromonadaceae bacterium]|nr:acyloxyacyl hydrolase [Desulfuromonadaceae bacterium]